METSSISLVGISPSLQNHIVLNKIIEIVVGEVQKIPQFEKLQRSMDLVLYICNSIEELVVSNGVSKQPVGYKKDLAIKIFEILKFNKPEDRDFLVNSIEFLCSSGKIKRVPFFKKLFNNVKRILVKNVNK